MSAGHREEHHTRVSSFWCSGFEQAGCMSCDFCGEEKWCVLSSCTPSGGCYYTCPQCRPDDELVIYKVHYDGQWCGFLKIDAALEEVKTIIGPYLNKYALEVGQEVTISVEKITLEEYENLPEFMGW